MVGIPVHNALCSLPRCCQRTCAFAYPWLHTSTQAHTQCDGAAAATATTRAGALGQELRRWQWRRPHGRALPRQEQRARHGPRRVHLRAVRTVLLPFCSVGVPLARERLGYGRRRAVRGRPPGSRAAAAARGRLVPHGARGDGVPRRDLQTASDGNVVQLFPATDGFFASVTADLEALDDARWQVLLTGWPVDNVPFQPTQREWQDSTFHALFGRVLQRGVHVRALVWANVLERAQNVAMQHWMNSYGFSSSDDNATSSSSTNTSVNGLLLFDNRLPHATSSHQQKTLVLSRADRPAIAYVGGIDLTSDHWDTRFHNRSRLRALRHTARSHDVWVDASVHLEGLAALDVVANFVARWTAEPSPLQANEDMGRSRTRRGRVRTCGWRSQATLAVAVSRSALRASRSCARSAAKSGTRSHRRASCRCCTRGSRRSHAHRTLCTWRASTLFTCRRCETRYCANCRGCARSWS